MLVDRPLDLDSAADEIRRRTPEWTGRGIDVRPISSDDQHEHGPSVGARLRKHDAEGEVVVYRSGRVELRSWSTDPRDAMLDEALDDCLTVERFGLVLDILVVLFA